jgi:hypothetical protein
VTALQLSGQRVVVMRSPCRACATRQFAGCDWAGESAEGPEMSLLMELWGLTDKELADIKRSLEELF